MWREPEVGQGAADRARYTQAVAEVVREVFADSRLSWTSWRFDQGLASIDQSGLSPQ
jgi:hypothetical protein